MSDTAEKIFDQVLQLDTDDRSALIVRLLDTIGSEQERVDELWRAEVRKRVAGIESGNRKLSSWKEARKRIFAQ